MPDVQEPTRPAVGAGAPNDMVGLSSLILNACSLKNIY